VTEGASALARPEQMAGFARVTSPAQRMALGRQAARLSEYGGARGDPVAQVAKEIAPGANARQPKVLAVLDGTSVTRIVEQRDRLPRCGFQYLQALLAAQAPQMEGVTLAEHDNVDVVADLVALVYSFTARLYGQRRAKRQTERIAAEVRGDEGEGAADAVG
jgi:putative resolvase